VIRGSFCGAIWRPGTKVDALTAYRFFHELGEGGVGGAIVAVVGRLADNGVHGRGLTTEETAARGRRLLESWFERHDEIVDIQPLLSGDAVMRVLDVEPGPIVGRALRRLTEAQVQGLVETEEEAVAYLRQAFGGDTR
jgi:hypothetical protein